MSDIGHLNRVIVFLPKYHQDKIRKISKSRHISMARLIAFAIDRELQIERPFTFECEIPSEDYVEFAYAHEASKILDLMKTLRLGTGLDILLLLRFEIGVEDKTTFLAAFKECVDQKLIESFIPPVRAGRPPNHPDYLYWRVVGTSPKAKKAKRKKATQFETYERLKKKFDKEK